MKMTLKFLVAPTLEYATRNLDLSTRWFSVAKHCGWRLFYLARRIAIQYLRAYSVSQHSYDPNGGVFYNFPKALDQLTEIEKNLVYRLGILLRRKRKRSKKSANKKPTTPLTTLVKEWIAAKNRRREQEPPKSEIGQYLHGYLPVNGGRNGVLEEEWIDSDAENMSLDKWAQTNIGTRLRFLNYMNTTTI